jgi:hypothetical protein
MEDREYFDIQFKQIKEQLTTIMKNQSELYGKHNSNNDRITKNESSIDKNTVAVEEIKETYQQQCTNLGILKSFALLMNTEAGKGLKYMDVFREFIIKYAENKQTFSDVLEWYDKRSDEIDKRKTQLKDKVFTVLLTSAGILIAAFFIWLTVGKGWQTLLEMIKG